MGMFHKVKVGNRVISPIDWEMNPDLSFGTFESWGGRERVRNNKEFVYYFFVDNWGPEPKLCLMERAVKHARIMAEIKAPPEIVKKCVTEQGQSSSFEKSYAINEQIKEWLIDHVLDERGRSAAGGAAGGKDRAKRIWGRSCRPWAGPFVRRKDSLARGIRYHQ